MNDPAMTALVRSAATRAIGAENVIDCEPSMGGDDMAYFQKELPGCYFIVGGGDEEGEYGPHHSGTFGFDERALGGRAEGDDRGGAGVSGVDEKLAAPTKPSIRLQSFSGLGAYNDWTCCQSRTLMVIIVNMDIRVDWSEEKNQQLM